MCKRQIGVVTILALMFALGAVTASAATKTITIRVKGVT
jgi:hypothetical protein